MPELVHHGGTEGSEVAQRKSEIRALPNIETSSACREGGVRDENVPPSVKKKFCCKHETLFHSRVCCGMLRANRR